jgi:hypothetical protein
MSAVGPETSVSPTPEIDGKFIGRASEDDGVGFCEIVVIELSAGATVWFMG